MKQNRRLRMLAKQAAQNINNAYNRISELETKLDFQGFGDRTPEVVVTNDPECYRISLCWNDTIFDILDVIEAHENHLKITPRILEEIIVNYMTE